MDKLRKELLRRELATRGVLEYTTYFDPQYQVQKFHEVIAAHLDAFLEAVERKGSPRLMIFAPPRHGKSELISRNFPTYALGKHPEYEIISASATDGLAQDFGLWVSNRVNDERYLDMFPKMKLDPSRNAVSRLRTLKNGGYTSLGVGTQVVGKGAHIGIIDDPVAGVVEAYSELEREKLYQWYLSNMQTRLAPGGGILLMHQRWTTDDLAARLIKASTRDVNASKWVVLNFPAMATEADVLGRAIGDPLDPGRWPKDALTRIKADFEANGNARGWAALYQQSPHVESGNFFKKEHIKYYTTAPEDLSHIVCADYAVTLSVRGDKTAIFDLGVDYEGNVYVMPVYWWGRWESLEIVEKTVALAKKYDARVLASEHGPIQGALRPLFAQEMEEQEHYLTIEKNLRRAAKIVVAHALRGLMEAGKFFFPNIPEVRNELIPNLLAFSDESPGDDDAVDALCNGAVCIESIGRPLPPMKEPPKPWRQSGKVYMEDLSWGKKNKPNKIPKLRGKW